MILIGNQTLRQSGRPNYLSSTIFFGRHQHLENFDQTPIEFGLSISHWKIDLNHWSINFIQISTDHCPSNIKYLFFVEPTLRQFGWPDNRSSTISLGEFPTLRNFDQIPDESGPSISKPSWSWPSIDPNFQMIKNEYRLSIFLILQPSKMNLGHQFAQPSKRSTPYKFLNLSK